MHFLRGILKFGCSPKPLEDERDTSEIQEEEGERGAISGLSLLCDHRGFEAASSP